MSLPQHFLEKSPDNTVINYRRRKINNFFFLYFFYYEMETKQFSRILLLELKE